MSGFGEQSSPCFFVRAVNTGPPPWRSHLPAHVSYVVVGIPTKAEDGLHPLAPISLNGLCRQPKCRTSDDAQGSTSSQRTPPARGILGPHQCWGQRRGGKTPLVLAEEAIPLEIRAPRMIGACRPLVLPGCTGRSKWG